MSTSDRAFHCLSNSRLFHGLETELLRQIAANAQWLHLERDEVLFRKGDIADAMYLAVKPGLVVSFFDQDGREHTTTVSAGEPVGEMQFLTGGRRTAEIRAQQETSVLKLPKSLLQTLGKKRAAFLEEINRTVHRRLLFNELMQILPSLFGELDKSEVKAIRDQSELVRIPRGEALFHQGEAGDAFYILMTGYMAIEKRLVTGDLVISNYLRRGEIIGEMALLAGAERNFRSATIRAMRDSELFKFPAERFYQFLTEYPSLLLQISRILANRLHETEHVRVQRQSNNRFIAVVAHRPDVPLHEFATRLKNAFPKQCSRLQINSRLLDQQLGTPGISQITDRSSNRILLSSWFYAREQDHDFILLESDDGLSQWSRRCIRLADHVIVVASAAESEQGLGELEEHLYYGKQVHEHARPTVSLVLLHPDGDRLPSGTAEWLEKRQLTGHFHVRWDREQDIERLARYLSGRSVGLVLSGGGARGFAHLGAMHALEEYNIPIDIVGGASMGAVLAAEYALGRSLERIAHDTGRDVNRLLFDYTLPLTSLFAGRRMARGLREIFGTVHIEDLWLPFFCISSNLTRARQQVHRRGLLWPTIQASNAAPGILPPVVLDGDLHVDGALLNNLPADVMHAHCNGKVIAVDVSPAVDLQEIPPYGDGLSGWRVLWHKLNPLLSPLVMPGIRSILRRSGELASISNRQQMLAEYAPYYLKMPVAHFQPEDYGRAKEIIKTGYDFARRELEGIFDDA